MNGKRLGLHSVGSPWVCFHLAPAPWLPTLHACIGCEEVFGDNLQWISVCILGWFLSVWLSERPTGCKQNRLCVDVLLPYCRLYWMGSEERGVWKSHSCPPGDLQLCVLACGCVCVHLFGWGVWKKTPHIETNVCALGQYIFFCSFISWTRETVLPDDWAQAEAILFSQLHWGWLFGFVSAVFPLHWTRQLLYALGYFTAQGWGWLHL